MTDEGKFTDAWQNCVECGQGFVTLEGEPLCFECEHREVQAKLMGKGLTEADLLPASEVVKPEKIGEVELYFCCDCGTPVGQLSGDGTCLVCFLEAQEARLSSEDDDYGY